MMNHIKNERILLIHKFLNLIIILFAGFLLIYGITGMAVLLSIKSLKQGSDYRMLVAIATLLAGILSLFSLKAIDKAILAFYDNLK